MPRRSLIVSALACASLASAAHAQLRVASWNLTEYSGQSTRTAAFQGAIFGIFQGRTMTPDVIVVEEVDTTPAATTFLNMLNTAPGSPADYAMATFVNGNDSDVACYYRTSKFTLGGTTVAVAGISGGTPVRNVMSYKLRPAGFSTDAAGFYLLACHLKASDTSADASRRLTEATAIRNYLQNLPAGSNFMLAGDFNIYRTTEGAWTKFIGSEANNNGRLSDPIHRDGTPGGPTWVGAGGASVQTQSPTSAWGGMDDRFDFIMISDSMRDIDGISYIGNPNIAYGSSWNDPNHSYRCWGNDGTSFNQSIKIAGNAMVGQTIAQALFDHFAGTNSPPHLPVFLDVQVPAKLAVTPNITTIDFGTVNTNSVAQQSISIENATNVALFSKAGDGSGIDTLNYTFTASAGFTAPAGGFIEPAGGPTGGNSHTITLDTSTPGLKTGTLTITSDDPDQPTKVINLTGIVGSIYDFDVNNDGVENSEDLYAWFTLLTDVDGNGMLEQNDLDLLAAHLRETEQTDVINARR